MNQFQVALLRVTITVSLVSFILGWMMGFMSAASAVMP